MSHKDLIIINNEKIYTENDNFYCDNLDLKILPEELNNILKSSMLLEVLVKKKIKKLILKILNLLQIF